MSNEYEFSKKGCWEWSGAGHSEGYGTLYVNGVQELAHRHYYRIYVGEPGPLCVLHTCDNRKCVNPAHLFLGTKNDNNQDMIKKGRMAVGSRSGQAKLTEDQVVQIRYLYGTGPTQADLALMFGISQPRISSIVNNKNYKES